MGGTAVELERRTLRTVRRLTFSIRAISRLLTCWAFSSRIALRCGWLNMRFLRRFSGWDFGGQALQFLERSLDLVLQRGALRTIQFEGGAGQTPVGPAGNRRYHLQVAQQLGNAGRGRRGF